MSDLRDQLEETVLAHWREITKPRRDEEKIHALAQKAKELRAAIKKGAAA